MPPTGQQQSTGQFGRFRLSNHPKLSHNTAANAPAPGQCSRFRVSDFVPYDSSGNHSSSNGGGGVSNSGGGAVAGATGGGSSNGPATPERLQKSPTMNTTPVANGVGQNGAGSPTMKPQAAQSGFGMLRMETQTTTAGDQPPPPLQQQQQQSGGKEQQQGQDTTGNVSLLLSHLLSLRVFCAYSLDVDEMARVLPRNYPSPPRYPSKLHRHCSSNLQRSNSIRWNILRWFAGS